MIIEITIVCKIEKFHQIVHTKIILIIIKNVVNRKRGFVLLIRFHIMIRYMGRLYKNIKVVIIQDLWLLEKYLRIRTLKI